MILLKWIVYVSMVRSLVEFGATIWNPTTKDLVQYVESLQRKATNILTNNPPKGAPNCMNYKTSLQVCNLLPLTFQREIIDLIMFLKCLNASNSYACSKYIQFSGNYNRSKNRKSDYRSHYQTTKTLICR